MRPAPVPSKLRIHPPVAALAAQRSQFGKLQKAFGLEPLQQLPALVILQPSTGPCPLQQLTDGASDLGHSETGKVPHNLTHQVQFAGAERASAKGQGFGHVIRVARL